MGSVGMSMDRCSSAQMLMRAPEGGCWLSLALGQITVIVSAVGCGGRCDGGSGYGNGVNGAWLREMEGVQCDQ
jgi:hypothetical protein